MTIPDEFEEHEKDKQKLVADKRDPIIVEILERDGALGEGAVVSIEVEDDI